MLAMLLLGYSTIMDVTFRLNFENLIKHRQRMKRIVQFSICGHVCAY